MSLNELNKVREEGVEFRSHLDGSKHLLTPESAMQIQDGLGTDIAMSLDHLIELPAPIEKMREAVDRTLRWAQAWPRRTRAAARTGPRRDGAVRHQPGRHRRGRARALLRDAWARCRSTASRSAACGWVRAARWGSRWWSATAREFPRDKPRYLMGVGHPVDVVEAVGARRGHDGLRAADAERAPRHRVHLDRPHGRAQRGLRARRAAARSRVRLLAPAADSAAPTCGTCSFPANCWACGSPRYTPCTRCARSCGTLGGDPRKPLRRLPRGVPREVPQRRDAREGVASGLTFSHRETQ